MSMELGKIEGVGSVASELGKGVEAIKVAFEKGESLTPHIESMANWLEDRTMEGVDQLQAVLEWVDGKLDTELAGMSEDLRNLVSEVFGTIKELLALGKQFVQEHPEITRGLATIVALLAGPELGPVIGPFLRQSEAELARMA